MAQLNRIEQFKSEASRAGAKVQEYGSLPEIASFIIGLARQHTANKVVISSPMLAGLIGLGEQLANEGIKVVDVDLSQPQTQQKLREACIEADFGISEATVAIAETGTIVIASDDGISRLAAVLPHLHITLVNCQNIVADLDEAVIRIKSMAHSTSSTLPTYVTFITGRNTTADIPGALLARAQGPAEEHILLIHL